METTGHQGPARPRPPPLPEIVPVGTRSASMPVGGRPPRRLSTGSPWPQSHPLPRYQDGSGSPSLHWPVEIYLVPVRGRSPSYDPVPPVGVRRRRPGRSGRRRFPGARRSHPWRGFAADLHPPLDGPWIADDDGERRVKGDGDGNSIRALEVPLAVVPLYPMTLAYRGGSGSSPVFRPVNE